MEVKKIYLLRKLILERIHTRRDIDFVKIDENLTKEIEDYFSQAEEKEEVLLSLRKEQQMDPNASLKYFRAIERIEIRRKVLQLLLAIALNKVPNKKGTLLFKQLYDSVMDMVKLFEEKDVFEGSKREVLKSEFLTTYIDDFEFFYKFNKDEIENHLKQAKENKDFILIFEALFLMALFWFTIREGNIEKIRKSDLFIYLLSKKLKEEYQKV